MLSSNQESSYRTGGLMEINKVSDQNNAQKPQPKRHIRRRLHTSKPYQENFMNMAEARREIATALKFHRASMKQQQAASNHDHQSPPPELEREPVSGLYSGAATTNYWPMSTLVPPPPPMNQENFNLELPNQTLGLNLNFKDFNNLNTSVYYNPLPASYALSAAKEVAVVDSSARWCKTNEIGTVEDGKRCVNSHEDGDWCYDPFEQVMEFPPWLNETSCSQHLFDDQLSHEYSPDPDPALPCMDIDDIEGMDSEEWLA